MGNLEQARDLGQTIYTQAETDSKIVELAPRALSTVTSSVLLSGNLAIADTAVTKNFDAVTYTGNGSTQNIVTGISSVDFTQSGNGSGYYHDRSAGDCIVKTDAGTIIESGECVVNTSKVHIKSRSAAGQSNNVIDGLRGKDKVLYTDLTNSEANDASKLSSFNSDGVSLLSNIWVNNNATTYILYQTLYTHIKWGLTSQGKRYIEAFNPITGDTMIMYQGSGVAGHQIPHSLDRELDFAAAKDLDATANWMAENGNDISLRLNTSEADATQICNYTKEHIVIYNSAFMNTSNNSYILYGKAKSTTWTIVNYTGTGASGNFVETKDVNGVARRPARVIAKRVDDIGNWWCLDNERGMANGNDDMIFLNSSDAEYTSYDYVDTHSNGFSVNQTGGNYNTAGGQYIALVEFDTNGDGGGSYFDLPTDDTNLNITNGVFSYTNGKDDKGYVRSTESYTGSIDFTGVSDGIKWIGKEEGGSFRFEDKQPSIGLYEKQSADDNRLVCVDGKWYETTGDAIYENDGTTLSGISSSAVGSSTRTLENGMIKLTNNGAVYGGMSLSASTIIGEKYVIEYDVSQGTASITGIWIGTSDNLYDILSESPTFGNSRFEFVAQTTTTYFTIYNKNDSNAYSYFDNISVYKVEPTLDTEVATPISFLRKPYLITSETPQYEVQGSELAENIVDSIEAGKFVGKNACTAWVNFDGTTTPPTIRDSFNVSDVVRVSTGRYDVYFDEPMNNPNYVMTGTVCYAFDGAANYLATSVAPTRLSTNPFTLSKATVDVSYDVTSKANMELISLDFKGGKN